MVDRHEEGCYEKQMRDTFSCEQDYISNDDVEEAKGHRISGGDTAGGAGLKTGDFVEIKVGWATV